MVTPAQEQAMLALSSQPQREPSTMELLQMAVSNGAGIEVVERIARLKRELEADQAKRDFSRALQLAQQEVPSITPNKDVKTSGGKLMYSYATYEQLDKVLRPIYIKYGMAISFNGAEAPAGKVRVLCLVSHRNGHTEPYQIDLAIDQGAAQLTKTDAELAAQSKAKRRILRNIFNIVDDLEDEVATNGEVMEAVEKMMDAGDNPTLMHYYKEAYAKFQDSPDAIKIIVEARLKRQKQFKGVK